MLIEEMQQKTTNESLTLGNALTVENMGRTKERGKSPTNCGKSQGKSKKGKSKSREIIDC
jgi:hypothetical protein